MAQIVRLGDTSDHGGKMISASGHHTVNGITVCVSGDIHSCPIKDHNDTGVIGGGGYFSSGKRVIRTGDVAGCGATITSGSPNTTTK